MVVALCRENWSPQILCLPKYRHIGETGMKVGEGAGTNKIIKKKSSSLSTASCLCGIGNSLFVVSEQDIQSLSWPGISWERGKKREGG